MEFQRASISFATSEVKNVLTAILLSIADEVENGIFGNGPSLHRVSKVTTDESFFLFGCEPDTLTIPVQIQKRVDLVGSTNRLHEAKGFIAQRH